MEIELRIKGTIDEISQITELIQKKSEREKELLHPKFVPASTANVFVDGRTLLAKGKKTGGARVRPVNILMGSIES